jgi:chemotaxis response regulator CheB
MAYVYVQHLSPQHESALTKILSHHFKWSINLNTFSTLYLSISTTYVD